MFASAALSINSCRCLSVLDESHTILLTLTQHIWTLPNTLTLSANNRSNPNIAHANLTLTLPLTLTGAAQTLRMRTLLQLQCASSGCIDAKDMLTVFNQMIKDLTPTEKPQLSPALTVETLLDVCRVAWQLDMKEVAVQCFDAASAIATNPIPAIRVKLDLCKALMIVAESTTENPNLILEARLTSREAEGHVISRRIEAVRRLERIIPSCQTRLKDNVLLQEICIAGTSLNRMSSLFL